jgi:hypothetical protein
MAKRVNKSEEPKEEKIVTVEVTPPPKVRRERLMVKAYRKGQYGIVLREVGHVFAINRRAEFSHTWMQALNFTPPAPSAAMAKVLGSQIHRARTASDGADAYKGKAPKAPAVIEYVETAFPEGAVTEVLPETNYSEEGDVVKGQATEMIEKAEAETAQAEVEASPSNQEVI